MSHVQVTDAAAPPRLIPRLWLPVLFLTSIGIAFYALSYLGDRAFPSEVAINRAGLPVLLTHATAGGAALLLGPWQFIGALRARWPIVHRVMGYAYISACLVAAGAGMLLALGTANGAVALWGFFALGAAWAGTTLAAVLAAWQREYAAHRAWMIRSFSLAFAAVVLRVYLPAALAAGIPFEQAYPAIAWLCWVPNLIVAHMFLRRHPVPNIPVPNITVA